MAYVANARMYSVDPGAASAWKELFEWLARASGVDLRVIDHAFPAPLAELWSRPDLGCAFMCGFPYKLSKHPPRPVAAPVPLSGPVPGRPVYATRLVVKADSSFRSLQDTFGGRQALRSRIPIPATTRCGIICCRIGRPRAATSIVRASDR